MFGAQHTLLLLTSSRLARLDLAGRGGRLRVEKVWSRPALESNALAPSVALALQLPDGDSTKKPQSLRLGLPSQRKIWVLSSDFWTGTVTLPLDVTIMLQRDELDQALKLEAENQSGISAFASNIGHRPIVDTSTNCHHDQQWWITQVSHQDLQTIESTIKNCGARLAGLAHPAIAQALSDQFSTDQPLIAQPDAKLQLSESDVRSFDLDEISDAALQQFGMEWARYLAARNVSGDHSADRLLIEVNQATTAQFRTWSMQAGIALLAVSGLAGLYTLKKQRLQTIEQAIVQLEQQQSTQQSQQKQLLSAESSLAKLRQEVSQARAQQTKLTQELAAVQRASLQQHRRWKALLDALALHAQENCWVKQWTLDGHDVVIHGFALDSNAVHQLARSLERNLAPDYWQIQPADTKLTGNGLVSFQIMLVQPNGDTLAHSASVAVPLVLVPPSHIVVNQAAPSVQAHGRQP
ncbi:MAG: PilN domain-containing protein [Pirellulaceae bacterium]|nr:PilN domain-containing protein [Pirellulaceae bacterium]